MAPESIKSHINNDLHNYDFPMVGKIPNNLEARVPHEKDNFVFLYTYIANYIMQLKIYIANNDILRPNTSHDTTPLNTPLYAHNTNQHHNAQHTIPVNTPHNAKLHHSTHHSTQHQILVNTRRCNPHHATLLNTPRHTIHHTT